MYNKNMKKYLLLFSIIYILVGQVSFAQTPALTSQPTVGAGEITIGQKQVTPVYTNAISSTGSSLTCTFNQANSKITDVFNYGTCLISKSIIPILFLIASIVFIWGVIQYVINSDDEEKRAKGKQFMVYGLIALAVAVSIWGLVGILTNTFSLQTGAPTVSQ
jgi:hypothetical protein